jgi:GAF domain-containing protein
MAGTDPAQQDPVVEVTDDLARAARVLFAAGNPSETVTQVLALAVATVEGCDLASVVLVDPGPATAALHTDPAAGDLDGLQQRYGQGPTLDAISAGLMAYVEDLRAETRWPAFVPRAAASGVRSVLSLPLVADRTVGALTLYARFPRAFGVIDRARGVLLAVLAALALVAAQGHEEDERREANLNAALATREIIGQAQGILIERERVTADQAFDILRRASQHLNQKLRDVAQTLIDTGETPGRSQPRLKR